MVLAQVKTTLAKYLLTKFLNNSVLLAFDDYYHDLSEMPARDRSSVNYDHPDSLDTELFVGHMRALNNGDAIEVPIYDFATHTQAWWDTSTRFSKLSNRRWRFASGGT